MIKSLTLTLTMCGIVVAAQLSYAAGFPLSPAQGAPADIVLGPQATFIEKHAAEELTSYIKQITGAQMRTLTDLKDAGKAVVLIGRAETNPVVAHLINAGKVTLSADEPGLDGFVIKTVDDSGRSYLVLGGSQDRGTLYAVYDLLERFCHVGFFWDCERVPQAEALEFDTIDISSRPYFEIRQNFQGCAQAYSAWYWGRKDWKQEVDWMCKKKFNTMFVYLGREVAKAEGFKAMGVQPPPLSPRAHAEDVLAKEVIVYAHSLGIATVTPTSNEVEYGQGELAQAFRAKYPNAQYMDMEWIGNMPRWCLVHPADPLWVTLVSERVKQYKDRYGSGSMYNFDPLANETRPGTTPQEKIDLNVAYAKAVMEAIREVSPDDGRWVMSGWAFVDRGYWTQDVFDAYMKALPDDVLINDVASRYRELNYFDGKQWGFSVLTSFGGDTHLHGGVQGLINEMQALTTDPKARNCKAFYLNPEIVRHNPFYYDLACILGWDPRGITLEQYIEDYALRRYGTQSADRMVEALKELEKCAYSRNLGHIYYQFQASVVPRETYEQMANRVAQIPSFRKVMQIALAEADRQQERNACYNRDLVDFGKEYLASVSTRDYLDLLAAFKAGDQAAFDDAAKRMRASLEAVQQIVGLCREYYIAEEAQRAAEEPYNLPLKDATVDIRGRYTLVEGKIEYYPSLLDYARRDLFELIRDYYRPRMELLINHLDECLKTGQAPSDTYLFEGSKQICINFIKNAPLVPLPPARDRIAEQVKDAIALAGE
jgi:alpha-N-acetylglucosaminidase